jgi:hypothetical protein
MTGFAASMAPFFLVFPADDYFNTGVIESSMVAKGRVGCDVVCASRFVAGGAMIGCRWLKALLVRTASFTLYHLARLPTHDASMAFGCSRGAQSARSKSNQCAASATASNCSLNAIGSAGASAKCRRNGSSARMGQTAFRL